MSYEIERGKRVLSLKTADKRLADRGEILLFAHACASNNVSPRTYDWSVCAIDTFRVWSGNIMLPLSIWNAGYAADGGSIKPWGKGVSGLTYVKAWKDAVVKRRPVDGWKPLVSLYLSQEQVDQLNRCETAGPGIFAAYMNDDEAPIRHAAFKRLFSGVLHRGSVETYADTPEALLDAIYLRHGNKQFWAPYLSDHEGSPFMDALATA